MLDAKRRDNFLRYWRASLVSRMFNSVSRPRDFPNHGHGVAYDAESHEWSLLELESFLAGDAPIAFVQAVFDRLDREEDERARKKGRTPVYATSFQAELAALAVKIQGEGFGKATDWEMPIFAIVEVGRTGKLAPFSLDDKHFPPPLWFPRRFFSDSDHRPASVRFGPFADYLTYVERDAPPSDDWNELTRFLFSCWEHASGNSFMHWRANLPKQRLTLAPGWIRVGISDQASLAIVRMYSDLIFNDDSTPLLDHVIEGRDRRDLPKNAALSAYPYGHMGATALSDSQRDCAAAFIMTDKNEAEAINGPPGSGKTTLLRSLVADLVVRSVIDDRTPPIIFGCAATNQAVTNLIDAFGSGCKSDVDDPVFAGLAQRWIDGLVSYGSYCKARYRQAESKGQLIILDPIADFGRDRDGAGQQIPRQSTKAREKLVRSSAGGPIEFGHILTHCCTEEARRHWLECADAYLEGAQLFAPPHVDTGSAVIRRRMGALAKQLRAIVAQIDEIQAHIRVVSTDHEDALDTTSLREELNRLLLEYCFGGDTKLRHETLKRLLATQDFSEDGVPSAVVRTYQMAIDVTLRRKAFHLAARYREGDLLVKLLKAGSGRRTRSRIEDFELAACLTPVFVSTFDRLGSVWRDWNRILWGHADLLILDEAGQASPDKGMVSLGIARRAIAVGDVKQLPPVEGQDAPMYAFHMATKYGVNDDDTQARGLLCGISDGVADLDRFGNLSSIEGSMLRAISAASSYSTTRRGRNGEDLGPGMGLFEHFRCVPEIIAFSNDRWYFGSLNIRTKPHPKTHLPALTHIDVRDPLLPRSSRENKTEANAIIEWLAHEQGFLLEPGRYHPDPQGLSDVVAILTPFKLQAYLLKRHLKAVEFRLPLGDQFVCGTVHSLQGAERPVVIFSTTYSGQFFSGLVGNNEYFFDRQSSILNVAITRAQKLFVCFGDWRVFAQAKPGSPTSELAKHLTRHDVHTSLPLAQ